MDQVSGSPRARAIVLLAKLLDRLPEPGAVRLADDVTEIVDALIDAARAPESAHTRALRELSGGDLSAALDSAVNRVRDRIDQDRSE
jgi:hypothetical protein